MVFSFSIARAWARPRSFTVMFSSLMPRSVGVNRAAREDGDVLEHGLAAIAEAGLDGGDLQATRSLLTTSVARASPSTVLGDDEERLAGLNNRLEDRQHRLCSDESFFSWMRM